MINWRKSSKSPEKTPSKTNLLDNRPKTRTPENLANPPEKRTISVRKILTVSSAKGGVGKSTIAVNLAVAMAKVGVRVGLLDADVYGPSCHIMLGTRDTKPSPTPEGLIAPVEAHGVKSFSIAYVSDIDAPILWRGPIVSKSIKKMFYETVWHDGDTPLDLLIIDTPPGTGEPHLTLAQSLPVTAALLVTTPSELSLADVRRGVGMYNKLEIPILGIVETLSFLEQASGRIYPFGRAGAEKISEATGIPVLAEIPILDAINTANTTGMPAALGAAGDIFMSLGQTVAKRLDDLQG